LRYRIPASLVACNVGLGSILALEMPTPGDSDPSLTMVMITFRLCLLSSGHFSTMIGLNGR
jgi:hypothetical protein